MIFFSLTLILGWKNEKQPSGPIELDLKAGNLVLILIMIFQGMANHLLRFQQVIHLVKKFWPLFVVPIQAGLTSLEVDFDEWEWEEELNVLTLEDVGLGKIFVEFSKRVEQLSQNDYCSSFSFNIKFNWTWHINSSFCDRTIHAQNISKWNRIKSILIITLYGQLVNKLKSLIVKNNAGKHGEQF